MSGVVNRGSGKHNSTIASSKVGASDDPPKADMRAEGENTRTAQTALVFLHLQLFHSNTVQVKTVAFLSLALS